MAKKIRLDFSKTEERSSFNGRHIPEGLHRMKIVACQETEAQDGTAMLLFTFVPTEAAYKARRFPYYCKLQPNQFWKVRDLLVAAGLSVPNRVYQFDPQTVVGKLIACEVEDDSYQGNIRSSVAGTYGLEILDEDSGSASEEDEDESDEPEDEPEEDEADEVEEDDLSTLSLAELRKRAKDLGIATAGMKTADLIEAIEETEAEDEQEDEDDDDDLDEDDLEDEDLADDDFEDDDEVEEPVVAKRRTAAKAPARRAAPAKAAPAKRTIQRRR